MTVSATHKDAVTRATIDHFVQNITNHQDDQIVCELCDKIQELLPELLRKAFGLDSEEAGATDGR